MRTGIDIVQVSRFKIMNEHKSTLNNVFTDYEISYIGKADKVLPRMAGLFAAKEAVLKAIGIGIYGGLKLTDVEIMHNDNGRPYVVLNTAINYYLQGLKSASIDISISHTSAVATAICILY